MNTLKSYISESLLDIDNINNSDALIEEFLKENYIIDGSYTIKNGIVDVKDDIRVINNNITHLTNDLFQFGLVDGNFICCRCNSLTSLQGAPKEVGGHFDCMFCNSLTSLKGAPWTVKLDFDCSNCKSLKTLEGSPKEVGKNFYCTNCKSLKTLKGAPKEVGKSFFCDHCGKKFTKKEVTTICKVNKNIII